MSQSSLRSRAYERGGEEEFSDQESTQELDTALRLAHHAQRLKAIEIGMENFSHALSAFKKAQRDLLRRQTIISLAVGAVCLAATLASAIIIQTHMPQQNVAADTAAPAPVASAAAPAPVAAPAPQASASAPVQPTTVIEAPEPAAAAAPAAARPVALGRFKEPPKEAKEASALPTPPKAEEPPAPPARQVSPFEQAVTQRLAASSQSVPASWQPIFAREAKGDSRAKLQIAAKFLKGEDVKADPTLAVTFIRQAASAGNKEAMMWLAYSYEAGNFGKPEPQAAVQWFSEAAKAGVVAAYTDLGRMYEKGIDGAPDPEAALAWYQRGAQAGDAKAAQAVQRLNRPANPESVLLAAEPPTAAKPQAPVYRQPNAAPAEQPAPTPAVATAPQVPDQQAAPATPESAENERSADIRAAQRMLKVLGYKIDKADGALGPQTQTAIRAYQRDHAAYPDGAYSPELMDSLARDIRYGQ